MFHEQSASVGVKRGGRYGLGWIVAKTGSYCQLVNNGASYSTVFIWNGLFLIRRQAKSNSEGFFPPPTGFSESLVKHCGVLLPATGQLRSSRAKPCTESNHMIPTLWSGVEWIWQTEGSSSHHSTSSEVAFPNVLCSLMGMRTVLLQCYLLRKKTFGNLFYQCLTLVMLLKLNV